MNDIRYTIILNDGTKITDLQRNGSCFIHPTKIDRKVFDGNLAHVTISDGVLTEEYHHMEFIQVAQVDENFWFALREIPREELERQQLRSDVDYLAMMADLEM